MNAHAMPTKDEIIALEKSYWDAIKAKDGDRTTELSAKSSLVTGARGVMRIAKEKMGKMTEEGEWTLDSYPFDNVEVSTPAPDVALIAYTVRQSVTMDGKSQDLRAADSSVWIRGGVFVLMACSSAGRPKASKPIGCMMATPRIRQYRHMMSVAVYPSGWPTCRPSPLG